MRRRLITTLVLACGVLAAGSQPLRQPTQTQSQPSVGRNIALADIAKVEVARAETATLTERRNLVGWVEAKVKSTISVTSQGVVVEKSVTDGATVRAGDILLRLDDREIKGRIARSKALLAREVARHARAEINVRRIETLAERGAATPLQVEEAELERNLCAADIAAREAELQIENVSLDRTVLRAPTDGYAGSVDFEVGSVVNPAQPLLTITKLNPVAISFLIADRDFTMLRVQGVSGWQARVAVSLPDGTLLASAPVVSVSETIDIQTGTIRARAELPNEDTVLWPGQYVQLSAELGSPREFITIPPSALIGSSQEQPYVFVARGDDTVEIRHIKVHSRTNDKVYIQDGLQAGDRVVIAGQLALADGDRITVHPNQLALARNTAIRGETP